MADLVLTLELTLLEQRRLLGEAIRSGNVRMVQSLSGQRQLFESSLDMDSVVYAMLHARHTDGYLDMLAALLGDVREYSPRVHAVCALFDGLRQPGALAVLALVPDWVVRACLAAATFVYGVHQPALAAECQLRARQAWTEAQVAPALDWGGEGGHVVSVAARGGSVISSSTSVQ
jgi:hypothetical protein